MRWTSGKLSSAIDVCAGELLTVLLTRRNGANERPDGGRPPSWRFSPTRAMGRDHQHLRLVRGEEVPGSFFYEADLSPLWLPDSGTVWLQGGVGVEYDAALYRVKRCNGPFRFVKTLREVGPVTPVALPVGTISIETNEDVTAVLAAAGESVSLRCLAGQPVPASNWAACRGTVAASFGTIQTIICRGIW